jgi:hypothetical protein
MARELRLLPPLSAARYERLLWRIKLSELAAEADISTRALSEFERECERYPLTPEQKKRVRLALDRLKATRVKSAQRNGETAKPENRFGRGEVL